jgi:hypothetical protein
MSSMMLSDDEIEKLNNSELNNMSDIGYMNEENTKKNISTQVDYVTLIMARNEDTRYLDRSDNEDMTTQRLKESQNITDSTRHRPVIQIDPSESHANSIATIHAGSNIESK